MVTGQGYGWVLVGVRGCVAVDAGMAWLQCFPYLYRLRTGRCIRHRGQVTKLLSRAHTWVWAQGRLVALLSWIQLFPDKLIGGGDGGGPCTALSSGLSSGGLESKFGRGPGHPGQESDGLVLLVPRVQAGRVSSGHPARHIDSRIAERYGMACLVFSTIVRTKS